MGGMFSRGGIVASDRGVEEAGGGLDAGGFEVFLEANEGLLRVTASGVACDVF